jgi:hypothetical protein
LYKVNERTSPDKKRWKPALAVVTGGVLAIAGASERNVTYLFRNKKVIKRKKNVTFYDIQNNTWRSNLSKLNEKRFGTAVCVVQGIVYVFGGSGY